MKKFYKKFLGLVLLVFFAMQSEAASQFEILSNVEPQRVFAGDSRKIQIVVHNPEEQSFEIEMRARLSQLSSATAVRLIETPRKKIQVLPKQTIIETAQFNFPPVRAETRFLIQWLENTNRIIGTTEVFVYPTNLLSELKPLGRDEPPGVFDPQNQLKPLLKNLKIEFADLEDSNIENFSGKLAIIGPFQSKAQMREGLANQIQSLAKKGVAVVWIQPPTDPSPRPSPIRWEREKLQPSFYSVPQGGIAVVVVQSALVADLAENPKSQLNLIYFCRLALNPEPVQLPHLTSQP